MCCRHARAQGLRAPLPLQSHMDSVRTAYRRHMFCYKCISEWVKKSANVSTAVQGPVGICASVTRYAAGRPSCNPCVRQVPLVLVAVLSSLYLNFDTKGLLLHCCCSMQCPQCRSKLTKTKIIRLYPPSSS